MTRDQWLQAFADELGVSAPSSEQIEAILALAGSAAHASERTAAPVAAWLVGLSGCSPTEALQSAKRIPAAD